MTRAVLRAIAFGGALAFAAAAGADDDVAALCADPNGYCAGGLSARCLDRFAAGAVAAADQQATGCEDQFAGYRDCIARAAESCAPGGSVGGVVATPACDSATALALWSSAERDDNCLGYGAYLEACPNTPQARFAAARARGLGCDAGSTDVAAPSPPSDNAQSLASLADFQQFQECDACPKMIALPAGEVLIGSPKEEAERERSEEPQQRITLRRFALARTEVTVAAYRRFIDATNYGNGDLECRSFKRGQGMISGSWSAPGFEQGESNPVVCVNWIDAAAYIDWLNQQLDAPVYRLPSEAEWEYAARAGSTTPFWTGAQLTTNQANFNGGPYGEAAAGENRKGTVAVGSLPANPWGFHEILGNAREWTADCWSYSLNGAPSGGAPRLNTGDCDDATLRGGSWWHPAKDLRSAARGSFERITRTFTFGFRLARDLPPR